MSRPLPFTAAGIARAIKGVEKAGRYVVGVKPDGTLIVADKPLDTAFLVPKDSGTIDLDRELADFEARHGQD